MKLLRKVFLVIGLVIAFLLILTMQGATWSDEAPRNVRLRVQTTIDTIYFDLRWVAPSRGRLQTPITGYDWELWRGTNEVPLDSLLAAGVTGSNVRRVDIAVPFMCPSPVTQFTGRVRARGDFSGPAPYGYAEPFSLACDQTPPSPPTVDLDTIPLDTLPSVPQPDSTRALPAYLPPGTEFLPSLVPHGSDVYRFTALQDTALICAISFRDGQGTLAQAGPWRFSSGDYPQVVLTNPYDTLGGACWSMMSNRPGGDWLVLCRERLVDCPVVASFGLAIFNKTPFMPITWNRPSLERLKRNWPLLAVAAMIWLIPSRRKKKCLDGSRSA